jgi:hypothetical protein
MKNKIKSTKLILTFIVVNVFFSSHLFAQDIVILRNGDEFKAKVEEVSDDVIKYYKWENLKGAKYSLKKADVFMIRYQTGYVEKYINKTPENTQIQSKEKKEIIEVQVQNDNLNYLSLSNLKLDLFANIGSLYLFEINGLQRELSLSSSNNSYFEFGVGFKKELKNNGFFGIDLVLGNQNYSVDAPYFYQKTKSSIPNNNVLSNWNITDKLRLYKLGVQTSFAIADKQDLNRLKMSVGLSDIIGQNFNASYEYRVVQTNSNETHVDLETTFSSAFNIDANLKYEHKIRKGLGVEFNLGLSYFPISGTKQIQDWNGNTKYEFNEFHFLQIKYGVGLLLY